MEKLPRELFELIREYENGLDEDEQRTIRRKKKLEQIKKKYFQHKAGK